MNVCMKNSNSCTTGLIGGTLQQNELLQNLSIHTAHSYILKSFPDFDAGLEGPPEGEELKTHSHKLGKMCKQRSTHPWVLRPAVSLQMMD